MIRTYACILCIIHNSKNYIKVNVEKSGSYFLLSIYVKDNGVIKKQTKVVDYLGCSKCILRYSKDFYTFQIGVFDLNVPKTKSFTGVKRFKTWK